MNERIDCTAAERLAGAIALGEARDEERNAYRGHLAVCAACLDAFGGEREIERVMAQVSAARDDERWEPDLSAARRRPQRARRVWPAVAALAACVAIVVGVRAFQSTSPAIPVHSAIAAQEARALAALDTHSVPRPQGRAESLALGTPSRSTLFEIRFDGRGVPVRCTIARSSGDRALDESICRAALRSHDAPANR